MTPPSTVPIDAREPIWRALWDRLLAEPEADPDPCLSDDDTSDAPDEESAT